jgi:hypothetical protein
MGYGLPAQWAALYFGQIPHGEFLAGFHWAKYSVWAQISTAAAPKLFMVPRRRRVVVGFEFAVASFPGPAAIVADGCRQGPDEQDEAGAVAAT